MIEIYLIINNNNERERQCDTKSHESKVNTATFSNNRLDTTMPREKA